jgi:polyhydroxybutyrate depolymerase
VFESLRAHQQTNGLAAKVAKPLCFLRTPMGSISCPRFAPALLAIVIASFASHSVAEDGPLRQRLRERMLQRQQQKPAPEASTDTERRITRAGDHTFSIQHDGLTRLYRVHVPTKLNLEAPAPMLLALHGGGGNMAYQADDANYGLVAKSEQEGFVVVFPNGYSRFKSGQLATWNAGSCCGAARDDKVDDVGFIRQVVATVSRQLRIDPKRIYATGMSNGAMMSYRLACEMPEVFAAVAAVAGTDNTIDCRPASPVSVLHIHARNDTHVLFDGGAGPGVPNLAAVTNFRSVPATVSRWTTVNGCTAAPRRVLDKSGAYCELHSGCIGDSRVELCVTDQGGHSWPGAKKTRGEPASQAISANDLMWDFFTRR